MGDDQSSYAEKLVTYLYVCTYDYGPRSEKFAEINNECRDEFGSWRVQEIYDSRSRLISRRAKIGHPLIILYIFEKKSSR